MHAVSLNRSDYDTLHLPLASLRRFRSPFHSDPHYQLFFAVMPVGQIPKDFDAWCKPRASRPEDARREHSIRRELLVEPCLFYFKVPRVVLIAEALEYDSTSNLCSVFLQRDSLHGIVEGAVTLRAIRSFPASVQGCADHNGACVDLQILTGIRTDQEIEQFLERPLLE
jgi:hypothetical protein